MSLTPRPPNVKRKTTVYVRRLKEPISCIEASSCPASTTIGRTSAGTITPNSLRALQELSRSCRLPNAVALKYAAESLKLDPYREDMHRLTLKIYAAQDKIPAAKKHFETMTGLLKDELGIEPSPETRRLAAEFGIG